MEPEFCAIVDPIWWSLSDGESMLGCGTGSLTFTMPEIANVASVTGVDLTDSFVEFARGWNTDPRISFLTADARALPFKNNSFDRVFSMLVLQIHPGRSPRGSRDGSRRAARRPQQPCGTTSVCRTSD